MQRRGILAAGAAASAVALHTTASAAASRSAWFPNVLLQTHEGRTVRFYDDLLKGRTVTLNFMFTGCTDICPAMTQNLVAVRDLLGARVGRDIFMYSFTLQPVLDTPAVLKAYAETFGVGPGWLFLTGDPADMELLRRRLGFVDPDPALDADIAQHIGLLRYGIEPRSRWAGCPALTRPEVIVRSIAWMEGTRGKA